MSDRKHILVIDHDRYVAAVVGETLEALGYRVSVPIVVEATQTFLDGGERPDLIVLDASSSERLGLDIALQARKLAIKLVMISGHPDLIEQFRRRSDQLLRKPFRSVQLARAIDAAFRSEVFGQRKVDAP